MKEAATISRPPTAGNVRVEYAAALAGIHLLSLLVFVPWLFSWLGVWLLVIGIFVFGQGINTSYHRLLTHRSFKVPKWLEHQFVILALCCMEDTPVKWVTTHRIHHLKSDQEEDPHSPWAGFFWGHCGWLLRKNSATHNFAAYQKYAWDVLRDPFYRRLEKGLLWLWIYFAHWGVFFLLGAIVGAFTAGTVMGSLQLGLSTLVWGAIARTTAVWHVTWSVNSFAHVYGYRNYETNERSRNNLLLGYLTLGEGWHNNHHHDQASASNQHRWWEVDMTYYFIKTLELVGLARDVIPPEPVRRARRERRRNAQQAA